MPDQKAKTRWLNVLVIGVGLLGFFLRIHLYIDNRSCSELVVEGAAAYLYALP